MSPYFSRDYKNAGYYLDGNFVSDEAVSSSSATVSIVKLMEEHYRFIESQKRDYDEMIRRQMYPLYRGEFVSHETTRQEWESNKEKSISPSTDDVEKIEPVINKGPADKVELKPWKPNLM